MNEDDVKMLLQEMEWVRKLLMLQTLAAGYNQGNLAQALGVSDATISRMMPKGFAKVVAKIAEQRSNSEARA